VTYVPPEKKQKGGTSGLGDFFYVMIFYLVEGLFIFVGIPVIVLALGIIPVAMYLVITGNDNVIWPLYLFGVLIVFFQILGIQFFVRKWILEPNKMTFGRWLRWRFSPYEIRKRRDEKRARSRKMAEWYDGMDRVKEKSDMIRDEQSYDLRSEWFESTGDPEILNPEKKDEFISLGEEDKSISFEISDSESISMQTNEDDNLEIEFVDGNDEESEEEEEDISYSWE